MSFLVVQAEDTHLPAIYEIEKNTFTNPWSLKMLESYIHMKGNIYFVALEDNQVCGFAGMLQVLDEGHISNIAVAEGHRGKGVGTALVDSLIQWSKTNGVTRLMLEVRESNAHANALYSKFGFLVVGLRRGYYEHPREDAVLMSLFLG